MVDPAVAISRPVDGPWLVLLLQPGRCKQDPAVALASDFGRLAWIIRVSGGLGVMTRVCRVVAKVNESGTIDVGVRKLVRPE